MRSMLKGDIFEAANWLRAQIREFSQPIIHDTDSTDAHIERILSLQASGAKPQLVAEHVGLLMRNMMHEFSAIPQADATLLIREILSHILSASRKIVWLHGILPIHVDAVDRIEVRCRCIVEATEDARAEAFRDSIVNVLRAKALVRYYSCASDQFRRLQEQLSQPEHNLSTEQLARLDFRFVSAEHLEQEGIIRVYPRNQRLNCSGLRINSLAAVAADGAGNFRLSIPTSVDLASPASTEFLSAIQSTEPRGDEPHER